MGKGGNEDAIEAALLFSEIVKWSRSISSTHLQIEGARAYNCAAFQHPDEQKDEAGALLWENIYKKHTRQAEHFNRVSCFVADRVHQPRFVLEPSLRGVQNRG